MTTATPATIAATVTPSKGRETVAIVTDASDPYSAAELSALVHAAAVAGADLARIGDSLAVATLDRFRVNALQHPGWVRTIDGLPVLLESHKRDVQALVWLEATGGKAPKADERTSGERSLAQYLSRYSTVATNVDFGMDSIATRSVADMSYTALTDGNKADREAEGDREFAVWLSSLVKDESAALTAALAIMATRGAAPHVAAFVREVNAHKVKN